MYATYVKNCFCPNDTWQVCHIGDWETCMAQKSDAAAQGVRAVVDKVGKLALWQHVDGGPFWPILKEENNV